MGKREKKSISVTIEKAAETPSKYDFFLMRTTEDALEIDLATKRETKDKVELNVQQSFSISSDRMIPFFIDLFEALKRYEEKYQNGKGFPTIAESKDTEGNGGT